MKNRKWTMRRNYIAWKIFIKYLNKSLSASNYIPLNCAFSNDKIKPTLLNFPFMKEKRMFHLTLKSLLWTKRKVELKRINIKVCRHHVYNWVVRWYYAYNLFSGYTFRRGTAGAAFYRYEYNFFWAYLNDYVFRKNNSWTICTLWRTNNFFNNFFTPKKVLALYIAVSSSLPNNTLNN